MKNVILKRKVFTAVQKMCSATLENHLCNIQVNGQKRGCSGFIVNKATGNCIYLATESSVYQPLAGKYMYRYAKNTKDFTGEENQWADCFETLVEKVAKYLMEGKR